MHNYKCAHKFSTRQLILFILTQLLFYALIRVFYQERHILFSQSSFPSAFDVLFPHEEVKRWPFKFKVPLYISGGGFML